MAAIVNAIAPRRQDHFVEIGPGLGALTGALLAHVAALDAIEIDRDAVMTLRQTFGERLRVQQGDALEFDFASLGTDLRIVGNLPYHISTPLLFRIDACIERVHDCLFMLQKEVVQRMAAAPDTADYGRLSVMLQYRWQIEPLFDVPPSAFRPQPKVWSSVVRMTPDIGAPRAVDEALLARLVTAAFSQRRKTLRNAMRSLVNDTEFAAAAIEPGRRGETLGVADFVRLADCVATRMQPPAAQDLR